MRHAHTTQRSPASLVRNLQGARRAWGTGALRVANIMKRKHSGDAQQRIRGSNAHKNGHQQPCQMCFVSDRTDQRWHTMMTHKTAPQPQYPQHQPLLAAGISEAPVYGYSPQTRQPSDLNGGHMRHLRTLTLGNEDDGQHNHHPKRNIPNLTQRKTAATTPARTVVVT